MFGSRSTPIARPGDNDVDNIEFQVADIYDLPFDDGQFDVVFSSAVLEHLADPVAALKSLRRVLKPGGLGAIIRTDWRDPFIVPSQTAPGHPKIYERPTPYV